MKMKLEKKINIKAPFGYGKKMAIPKTAQDTIPFIEAYDNGIFLTAPNTYTLIFAFENLDYTLFRESEQKETYANYQRLMNAIPSDVTYQEFLMNNNVNTEKLRKTLIPHSDGHIKRFGEIAGEYIKMMNNIINHSEISSSNKLMLISLCYKPSNSIENANVLFKYYREMQKYFANLKSDVRQLNPEEVFGILHDFYHPFDNIEFLLPKNIYTKGGSIKDYIAPSMFAFKAKEIEIGNSFTRVMYVRKYDREVNDGFIRDLLDNNKKVTVSKRIHRLDKSEALDKVNKEIISVQGSIQKRMENNHKSGTNFIPFKYLDRLKELEELQNSLSGSNCELFEVGIFISVSEESKEALEELTLAIKAKALKHQVRIDILVRQQEKGLNTVLPLGINHFSIDNGNNVNTYLLTDAACVLIPFSTRGYFSEGGIYYGINKLTGSLIVLSTKL